MLYSSDPGIMLSDFARRTILCIVMDRFPSFFINQVISISIVAFKVQSNFLKYFIWFQSIVIDDTQNIQSFFIY